MLQSLTIHNFALISSLDISFEQGFSVITGETGAGKSIILGALGLLLGNRADAKQIKEGATKCIVEATFKLSEDEREPLARLCPDCDWDEAECVMRREVTSSGKSRAFVNDTPTTLSVMKTVGDRLIDIHSQHQNLLLSDDNFQLNVLDTIAHNAQLSEQYISIYNTYKGSDATLHALQQKIADSKANEEYLRFQLTELSSIELRAGMQEELEESSKILSHAEDIGEQLSAAFSALSDESTGAITISEQALSALQHIADVYPLAHDLATRMESVNIEMADISSEIEHDVQSIEFNPAELERVNAELDAIYTLLRKYHVDTVEQLIEKKKDVESAVASIDDSDFELNQLQKETERLHKEAQSVAKQLTTTRQSAAKVIEKGMIERLKLLGMPDIQFKIELHPAPSLTQRGADEAQFTFSANKGTPLRPIDEIASGGEVARVMLSLKAMIASATQLPTIIFDEIDTGVSGRVAEQMAIMMKDMAGGSNQVISISHLPQIAAKAKWHYKVEKNSEGDTTETSMRMLNSDERIEALAQMLSGSVVSEAALENARHLLGIE